MTLTQITVVSATGLAVLLAVTLHYEVSSALTSRLARSSILGRRRVLVLILGLLAAHVAEIWLFGLFLWWLAEFLPDSGGLIGMEDGLLLDHVYMSAVTFTTLGYGDVVPRGDVRFLLGTEALTGFMLITWSASLTFLEMQRHWQENDA